MKEEKFNNVNAKSIIAVASGKGGVGKSTVTVNLALALQAKGLRVGLLDADIYGPNIPLMLGIDDQLLKTKNNKLIPIEKNGLKIISVAFLIPPEKALIWRGPMAHNLIRQFLSQVEWGELDVLVIDLPPGTGDVPLTLVQKANLTDSIIVTTPHEASIMDVKKMIHMFVQTGVNILGLVENMTHITCPDCSKKIELYPNHENRQMSRELGAPLMMELPFDPDISIRKTSGEPFYLSHKEHPVIDQYNTLADRVIEGTKGLQKP